MVKMSTERNPADLLTKRLPFDRIQQLCKLVGVEYDQDSKTLEDRCRSRCPRAWMRCGHWLALRQQVCQAVEALQHEATCRLPKSRDASGISPCNGSCAQPRVGKAAQASGAAVDVQFDGLLHPNFEGTESTGVAMWSKRSESIADDCAHSGAGISSEGCVNCISLSFCQHCSSTPAQIVRTPSSAVTSAWAQVFSKRVIHGIESQHSVQLGSRAMVTVEQANEIVATLRELETENLMKDLFNRALRTSHSGSDVKLNLRQAERHMPGMFNGKATEYTEYVFKMEAYLSTLDPGGNFVSYNFKVWVPSSETSPERIYLC